MTDRNQWKSLDELEGSKEVEQARLEEFKAKPAEALNEGGTLNMERRTFIKSTGAAAVFAGLSGCHPKEKLVPYSKNQPEDQIPGNPVYYATLDPSGSNGLLVKTTEGRPIKIDGHPDHPLNKGKLDAKGNALILDLYDPDRLKHSVQIDRKSKAASQISVASSIKELAQKLKAAQGKVAWVTKPVHGPANVALAEAFKKTFGASHFQLELNGAEEIANAQNECYGNYVVPGWRYDKAEMIISFGMDPMADGPHAVEAQRLISEGRRVKVKHGKGQMGRLIAFEPHFSSLGSISDERYRVPPEALAQIALKLVELIAQKANQASPVKADLPDASVLKTWGMTESTIQELADELWKDYRGKSLLIAGGSLAQGRYGRSLLNAVNYLNTLLGNDGKTVDYASGAFKSQLPTASGVKELLSGLEKSKFDVVILQDVNLAYQLAASQDFEKHLGKAKNVVGLFSHLNETALLCDQVFALNHGFESWNDSETKKGLFGLGQPVIRPIWKGTSSAQDYLIQIAVAGGSEGLASKGKALTWKDFIQKEWQSQVYRSTVLAADFKTFWDSALRTGFYDSSAKDRAKNRGPRTFKIKALVAPPKIEMPDRARLVLHRTVMHGDGESMNNPWMLEACDPISKIVWENCASVSCGYADRNGYKEGDIVNILLVNGQKFKAPVHLQPGLADNVVAIGLGWGRRAGGHVLKGTTGEGLGIDPLLSVGQFDGGAELSGSPVKYISKTGKKTDLVTTQGYHYMVDERMRKVDNGKRRQVGQEAFLEEFNDESKEDHWKFHYHMKTDISSWGQVHHSSKHKWAMAVDTSTCTGCNACVISCQAENNIPCVGKDEVALNREMHWIRIDRYFTSQTSNKPDVQDRDNVEILHQPVMCQQCDNAPCETVCPVVATSHSDDGLNIQTYNRCVGTRYCSNNCPYKVRHFNWYQYSDYRAGVYGSGNPLKRFMQNFRNEIQDKTKYPLMLQLNPDVTVRSYGVMEKCTFCIQRLNRWKEQEEELGRDLDESQKQVACQQACPSDSIVFGNINDQKSEVYKAHEEKGRYRLLMEINTQSNVHYMTKVRNKKVPENRINRHTGRGINEPDPHHGGGHDDHSGDHH